MTKKRIIVLNGIHASGKSTLAHLLADNDSRYRYFPEIGAQLREDADFGVLHSSRDFDAEIMRRELARDAELENCAEIPVVETWHFGNLAYILARSPELAAEYGEKIRQQLQRFEPQAVFLDINKETFRRRASTAASKTAPEEFERVAGFFQAVSANLRKIYSDYNIVPIKVGNEGAREELLAEVRREIGKRWNEADEAARGLKMK